MQDYKFIHVFLSFSNLTALHDYHIYQAMNVLWIAPLFIAFIAGPDMDRVLCCPSSYWFLSEALWSFGSLECAQTSGRWI